MKDMAIYLLSSSVAVAFVTAIKELIMWRLERKAKKEDKKDSNSSRLTKLESSVSDIKSNLNSNRNEYLKEIDKVKGKIDVSAQSDKIILREKIKRMALKHIMVGEITLDDRAIINEMWDVYHKLGGNGDLTKLMDQVNNLDITQ